jgi:hypothetical protein
VIEVTVEATAAFLLVNLLLTIADVGFPADSTVPAAGPIPPHLTIPGSAVAGAAVGTVVFVIGMWLRVRRPLIERFETANPSVAGALRTARDAVDDGHESRMAARLYTDVLERLRTTSSLGLVRLRRVAVTLVFVLALSAVTTQLVVYDINLGGGNDNTSAPPIDDDVPEFSGLKDGNAVLGDLEDVDAGDENLTARIESTGGDEGIDDSGSFPTAGASGGGGTGTVDTQQAGFAQPEQLEDAELIREYNLRIREGESD